MGRLLSIAVRRCLHKGPWETSSCSHSLLLQLPDSSKKRGASGTRPRLRSELEGFGGMGGP